MCLVKFKVQDDSVEIVEPESIERKSKVKLGATLTKVTKLFEKALLDYQRTIFGYLFVGSLARSLASCNYQATTTTTTRRVVFRHSSLFISSLVSGRKQMYTSKLLLTSRSVDVQLVNMAKVWHKQEHLCVVK